MCGTLAPVHQLLANLGIGETEPVGHGGKLSTKKHVLNAQYVDPSAHDDNLRIVVDTRENVESAAHDDRIANLMTQTVATRCGEKIPLEFAGGEILCSAEHIAEIARTVAAM